MEKSPAYDTTGSSATDHNRDTLLTEHNNTSNSNNVAETTGSTLTPNEKLSSEEPVGVNGEVDDTVYPVAAKKLLISLALCLSVFCLA